MSALRDGDPVWVNEFGDEYPARIVQVNDDDTVTVQSELTGNINTVDKDDIRLNNEHLTPQELAEWHEEMESFAEELNTQQKGDK